MRRQAWRALSLVGLVSLAVIATALPSSAHSISGYLWTNVDTDCATAPCVTRGNQVGAWQSILWADGYLAKCGASGIDGVFGSITKSATRRWQQAYRLTADGIVGPRTWGTARNRLRFSGAAMQMLPGGRLLAIQYWNYVGRFHTVHFQYSTPTWGFRSPANLKTLPYYATSHPGIFFARC